MGCGCYAAALLFYGTLKITKQCNQWKTERCFPGQETSDATYRHQSCVTVVSCTHTHTYVHRLHTNTHMVKLKRIYTCRHTLTCNAKSAAYLHNWHWRLYKKTLVKKTTLIMITVMATVMMNMRNIWAVQTLGKGGGDLIARELSYSVWFIPRWNSRGYIVTHHHHKLTTSAWSISEYALQMVFQSVGYNNDFSRQIDSQIKSSSAKRDHLECAACPSCAVEWWRVPLSPKVVGLSAGGKRGGGCRGLPSDTCAPRQATSCFLAWCLTGHAHYTCANQPPFIAKTSWGKEKQNKVNVTMCC